MGQRIQVVAALIGEVALFSLDRSLTGQDGLSFYVDTANGDAVTFFIDNEAPGIAIDTIWTEIEDQLLGVTETVVQPNTSCRLSDPRGWAFMQYGKTIEVQPSVYPFSEADDVAKIEWRLWDGECAECDCEGSPAFGVIDFFGDSEEQGGDCQSKVLAVREGAGVLDHVTLDPGIAPFVSVEDGFQVHTLSVTIWDSCGNSSTDCISLYILDITPSDAVILEPMNDDVFCQDHLGALYTISKALSDQGLSISLAKISTEGNRVADGFYVTDAPTGA